MTDHGDPLPFQPARRRLLLAGAASLAVAGCGEGAPAMPDTSSDPLWREDPSLPRDRLDAARLAALPDAARRWLSRSVPLDRPLAVMARIRMDGEMKLKGQWRAFAAEQVIHRERGFVWRAATRMFGLPVKGHDRLFDGVGEMQWRLAGFFSVASASTPDITRSAAGRWIGECFWFPPLLAGTATRWTAGDAPGTATARRALAGEEEAVTITVSDTGDMLSSRLERWGLPEGAERNARHPFGGTLSEHREFGGYRIPTVVNGGWWFGTDRYASEGEFFRARVTDASFR